MGWDGMVILVQESSKSTLGDMNIKESAKFSQKTSGSELASSVDTYVQKAEVLLRSISN